MRGSVATVGVVVARSGRLAALGDPLAFAMSWLAPRLGGSLRLVSRDSRSAAEGARRAVRELVRDEGAVLVLTLAGTEVLPAVADACEESGVPCVSSACPWQVHYYGRGAEDGTPFRWTYHFCWGLDALAETLADLWELAGGPGQSVGCLWNSGPQGSWSRHRTRGFAPVAAARGHRPRLITCSQWLAYPPSVTDGGARPAQADVATLVYWRPGLPYRSSLDGMTAAELAEAYERDTGRQWLQPLGPAYALFEVAAHALATAADPRDPAAVAEAIGRARLDTIAGPLDWPAGPVPNVATVPLAGGQWQRGTRHDYELAVVSNRRVPGLPVTAELAPPRPFPA